MTKKLSSFYRDILWKSVQSFLSSLSVLLAVALVGLQLAPFARADSSGIQVDLSSFYDVDGIAFEANPTDGDFDYSGNTYLADIFPDTITYGGVEFTLGPKTDEANNMVASWGQVIPLPEVQAEKIYVLAAEGWEDTDFLAWEVRYTDESTEGYNQGVTFWSSEAPAFGENIAYTFEEVNTPEGPTDMTAHIFVYEFEVDSEKTLEAIEIPDYDGDIRIMAITVVEPQEIVLTTPTVETEGAHSVKVTTAVVQGSVTDTGNATITERGIVYSASVNEPTIADSKVAVAGGAGEFSVTLSNLTDGQLYYARAFATNSEGTVYGEIVTFTTLPYREHVSAVTIPTTYRDLGIPQGMLVLPNGNIWYVDNQNYRVVQVTPGGDVVREFGGFGSSVGKFNQEVWDITRDAVGNLYVLDACRITKFDANGAYLTRWGSCYEATATSMREARGITYDATSNTLLVSDTEHHRIMRFSLLGQHLLTFGTQGSGNGQLNKPQGLIVDATGKIYVVDGDNHRVQVFSSTGSYLSKFGTSGTGNGQFEFPKDIIILPNGRIAVTAQNSQKVQVFNANGTFSHSWGTLGTDVHEFLTPYSLATDSDNNIYVSDWTAKSLQKFSSVGVHSWTIRNAGEIAGKFTFPTAVQYDSVGAMYVLDNGASAGRIQKFTNSGAYISTVIQPNQLNTGCYTFTIDADDRIIVSCSADVRVFSNAGTHIMTFGSHGTEEGQFRDARGVAVDGDGNFYVADFYNSRVQKFDSSGEFILSWGGVGTEPGEFVAPNALVLTSDNEIYVANDYDPEIGIGYNSNVQVFDLSGNHLRTIGEVGTEEDEHLWDVRGIYVDEVARRLYVLNRNTHDVKMFSHDEGVFLGSFGRYGSGLPEFTHAEGIAFNPVQETLVVADTDNHRLVLFADGKRIVRLITSNDVVREDDMTSLSKSYIDPSEPGADSIDSMMLFGDYVVAGFSVDLTDNRDWSEVIGYTYTDTSKSLLVNLNPEIAPGVSETHSLYVVKREGQDSIRVCPLAQTMEEVSMDCEDGYTLTEEDDAVEVVNIDGVDYWKVSGLTGTGIMSLSAKSLTITPSTVSITPGQSVMMTVSARNSENNIDSSYRETIAFSATESGVQLPANYTYTEVDAGSRDFLLQFTQAGTFTVTVTDVVNSSLTATSVQITVAAAPTPTPTPTQQGGQQSGNNSSSVGNQATDSEAENSEDESGETPVGTPTDDFIDQKPFVSPTTSVTDSGVNADTSRSFWVWFWVALGGIVAAGLSVVARRRWNST